MGASINSNNIKSIYYGGDKIKTVYLGDTVVYQSDSVMVDDASYNYYVYEARSGSVVELDNSRRGDTTEWDGYTYWGDGTVDNLLTHTYNSSGIYTIKTKWTMSADIWLIGCNGINKNMTDVRKLFRDFKYLKTVDLSNLNPDITDVSGMFYNCTRLTNVYNINTSNITNMSDMFYNCDNLDGSQFKDWDVSKVEKMSSMFKGATITNCLDLSSWDVSNVAWMSEMFNQTIAQDFIDISNWKLRNDIITELGVSFYAPRVLNMFASTSCNGYCKDAEHHVIHNNVSNNDWTKMKTGNYN